jgi:hypothetical protein
MVSSLRTHRISAIVGGLLTILGTFGFCHPTPPRIVDCAPGYHNSAGPDSDCIPNSPSPTPTAKPSKTR